MWVALETIGALATLGSMLGVAIGVTLGFTRKKWKGLAYCSVSFLFSVAVLIVAGRIGDTVERPGTTTHGEQARSESTVLPPAGPTHPVSAPTPAEPTQPISTQTPVAMSCPTPREEAYFSEVEYIMVDLGDDLAAFARLTGQASRDIHLLTDDYWESEMALVVHFLQSDADELENLHPPASVSAIHFDNLEMAETIRDFIQLFVQGMADFDVDTLEVAAVKMTSLAEMAETNAESVRMFCR